MKAFSKWFFDDESTRNNYLFAYRAPQWNSPKNSTKPIANWTPQPMAATTGANYRPMVRFLLSFVFVKVFFFLLAFYQHFVFEISFYFNFIL